VIHYSTVYTSASKECSFALYEYIRLGGNVIIQVSTKQNFRTADILVEINFVIEIFLNKSIYFLMHEKCETSSAEELNFTLF